ncbi:hypothetical protein SPI_05184 [Niveomyces insectorum RCEF 264]|uniref:DUF7820 domain-containing protein n=1 Tax=Niveomyces insectorum RCEF 264 TaxID=1081102 RepID=A0A167U1I5_9HYPO|nr:hypothetical protein SPI_05184 [Niveomyces insectorum RCEF 264]
MDESDRKATDFERRASRRISRSVSIHAAGGDSVDTADDNDYAAAALTVANGFGPAPKPTSPTSSSPAAASEFGGATSNTSLPSSSDGVDEEPRPSTSTVLPDTNSLSPEAVASQSSSVPPGALRAPSPLSPASPSSSSASSPPSSVFPVPATSPRNVAVLPSSSQRRSVATIRPSSIAKPPIEALAIAGSAYVSDDNSASSGNNNNNSGSSSDDHGSGSGSGSGSDSDAASAGASGGMALVQGVQGEEPYRGPSGPSFPYQLYTQDVRVARTADGSTTSTPAPSESPYSGPRGPTFPYTMYPQNTMAGPSSVSVPGVPIVGFPGMPVNYQRRVGPDGEDVGDMIGPDGHTEQLPPYSRYPDDAYTRKIAAVSSAPGPDPLNDPTLAPPAAPLAGSGLNSVSLPAPVPVLVPAPVPVPVPVPVPATVPAPVALPEPPATVGGAAPEANLRSIPGAGGIGLAPRNPEFDAEEDGIESPRARYSLRSFGTESTSGHEINTAAQVVNEKRKTPTAFQRIARRRICGVVPYWAVCLLATALVLMGVILGSVIGGFVAKHRRLMQQHHPGGPDPVAVTITVDATPIPTPPNLLPLPTGTFNLPLSKDENPSACFNDTTQAQAWSCSLSFLFGMRVSITSEMPVPGGPTYNISINCNESSTLSNNVFVYGEQPPVIPTPVPLQLVNDTLDPNRGPAWFKMLPYNKTVVVPESFLSVPTATPTAPPVGRRDGGNQLSGAGSFGAVGPFHRKAFPAQAGDRPWVCTWPDTILEIFIYPNQNTSLYKFSLSSTYTPASTTPTPTPPPPPPPAPTDAAASVDRADVTSPAVESQTTTTAPVSSSYFDMPPPPPPYPRVVKVEERRMANSPQATCVQYQLKAEGTGLAAIPNLDANGKTVEIVIGEIESGPPLFSRSERDDMSNDDVFDKRDVSGLSKCGCLWMVT